MGRGYTSCFGSYSKADSMFAFSQWETALLCNGVSHWLGANLESSVIFYLFAIKIVCRRQDTRSKWSWITGHEWFWPWIKVMSKWARWRLKSPASPLFTQPFIQAQIEENTKAPRHWPLYRKFTGDRWIYRNVQWRGKCFHLMTSSWNVLWLAVVLY